MASELARQILDAGFPAAKPVRDHDLFGIPTLEELIAAVEQLRPEVRLSVRRINPDEWEAHSGLLQSMVKSLIGHDMAQPPPKHWQSFGLPFTRHNRKRTTFVQTLPHNIERSSPQTKSPVACNRPTAAGSAYRAEVSGRVTTVAELCVREKCSARQVNMMISLAALPILEQMGYEVTTFKVTWGLPPKARLRLKSNGNADIQKVNVIAAKATSGGVLVSTLITSAATAKRIQNTMKLG